MRMGSFCVIDQVETVIQPVIGPHVGERNAWYQQHHDGVIKIGSESVEDVGSQSQYDVCLLLTRHCAMDTRRRGIFVLASLLFSMGREGSPKNLYQILHHGDGLSALS